MRSLGLDIGDRRTGVALSDPEGILATPLIVLASKDSDALIVDILRLAEKHNVGRIVVGLPLRLSSELGRQANKVAALAEKLSGQAKQSNLKELDVQLWDERLSTKAAERLKTDGGGRRSKLPSRAKGGARNRIFSAKADLDAIAAAVILQDFLDSHRQQSGEGS